ncbi:hypothetical protein JBO41_23165 [Enterobacter asburiae]|uniref:hypothetical protein n=1 Tax=Enterobacter cloacae complex TaxID=354276 RepID=UPI00068114B9|nr:MULTISPECIES: hypothetical protein [Enterobacter cloacae complex]MBL5841200.1 hypothetical protein [Enterobacter asburiae]MBL5915027.1 hypothetical protein [Enterobacter asburiae]MBL5919507.1 hypothetical protein [Enterobacter asburiae]MBL5941568.1 hypothetical protein [Enterobacter asburiae]MBL5972147.1 hypothetical protein [Enterobacter asburiae]
MKNKLIISFLLASVLTPSVSHAFGNRDSWVSGYAQGTSEYTILGKGQSQLYLACDSSGSQPATIIFTDVNGHQVSMDSGQTLTMKIDNEEEASISESDSHVGEGNLMWAWNKLRTGKRVIVSGTGAKPAVFTLKGAAGVIPAFGDNGCVAKFNIP